MNRVVSEFFVWGAAADAVARKRIRRNRPHEVRRPKLYPRNCGTRTPGAKRQQNGVTAGETALNQTASLAPADEVKGRRSTTARGAPVTRTELIRRCAALDSGRVRSAGLRSCSLSRATRRNHAAPDEGTRHHFGSRRRGEHTEYGRAYMPGHEPLAAANRARIRREIRRAERSWASDPADSHHQRAGTWHELRGSSARHLPMTDGRERGAAEAVNSARHGGWSGE